MRQRVTLPWLRAESACPLARRTFRLLYGPGGRPRLAQVLADLLRGDATRLAARFGVNFWDRLHWAAWCMTEAIPREPTGTRQGHLVQQADQVCLDWYPACGETEALCRMTEIAGEFLGEPLPDPDPSLRPKETAHA